MNKIKEIICWLFIYFYINSIVNINIESVPAVIRTRYGDKVHDIKLTGLIKDH